MNALQEHHPADSSLFTNRARTLRRADRMGGYRYRNRWTVPEPPSPTAVLCVDLREGRFETTEELIDLVLELDDRMRESNHMMILEGTSPVHRDVLSGLGLTNTQIWS